MTARPLILSLAVLMCVGAPAQTQRRIRVGGADHSAVTSSWPKLTVREGASLDQKIAAIGAFADQLTRQGAFSGVILIAKDGKPVFQRAYGLADRSLNVANTVDTKFNLGSINKLFTGIAVRQLASSGKLSLNDTVRKHLPDYPRSEADAITIAQLLEHRSGLGPLFNENWQRTQRGSLRSITDYLPIFINEPLQFPPGTKQQYSNEGYVLLGAIIEKVSGESYYDYVRKNIFEPLRMMNTDSYELDAVVPNRAVGYTTRGVKNGVRSNIFLLPARGSSAGGGYSTAPDLLKLSNAITSGRLKGGPPGGLGVGGGSPGVNALLEVDPKIGWTIVVLANLDPPAAEYAGSQIRRALLGEEN